MEKTSFGFINDLLESERLVLKALLTWDFSYQRANYRRVADKIGISPSSVQKAFLNLRERGILVRSLRGSYHICDQIKAQLLAELPKTEESHVEKPS